MKEKSPCFGCDRRTAKCHAECKDYLKWQKDHITKLKRLAMMKKQQDLSYIPTH